MGVLPVCNPWTLLWVFVSRLYLQEILCGFHNGNVDFIQLRAEKQIAMFAALTVAEKMCLWVNNIDIARKNVFVNRKDARMPVIDGASWTNSESNAKI